MDYAEALKQVQAEKKLPDNFMIIKVGYGNEFVLPYSDGVIVINALNHAEDFKDEYNKGIKVLPLEKNKFQFSRLSRAEYQHAKIAQLLGVTTEELTKSLKTEVKEEA